MKKERLEQIKQRRNEMKEALDIIRNQADSAVDMKQKLCWMVVLLKMQQEFLNEQKRMEGELMLELNKMML